MPLSVEAINNVCAGPCQEKEQREGKGSISIGCI